MLLINTIPVSVVGVLFIFVLLIISGMGWGGAQLHKGHSDNKVIKVKMIVTILLQHPSSSNWKQRSSNTT